MSECIENAKRPKLSIQQRFSEELKLILMGFKKIDVDEGRGVKSTVN